MGRFLCWVAASYGSPCDPTAMGRVCPSILRRATARPRRISRVTFGEHKTVSHRKAYLCKPQLGSATGLPPLVDTHTESGRRSLREPAYVGDNSSSAIGRPSYCVKDAAASPQLVLQVPIEARSAPYVRAGNSVLQQFMLVQQGKRSDAIKLLDLARTIDREVSSRSSTQAAHGELHAE